MLLLPCQMQPFQAGLNIPRAASFTRQRFIATPSRTPPLSRMHHFTPRIAPVGHFLARQYEDAIAEKRRHSQPARTGLPHSVEHGQCRNSIISDVIFRAYWRRLGLIFTLEYAFLI